MKLATTLFFLWSFSMTAQKSNLDSLWQEWQNPTNSDTVRLRSMSDFIWDGFLFSKPDSAFTLASLEYEFAKEKGISIYQSDALNIQGISYAVRGKKTEAVTYFTKNLTLAESTNNKNLIAKMANNIAVIHRDRGDYDKAYIFFQKSYTVFKSQSNSGGMAAALNNLGISTMYQGNYGKAYEYFDESRSKYEEVKDQEGLGTCFLNTGNLFRSQGDLDHALEYYGNALDIGIKLENIRLQASSMGNIGLVFKNKGEYDTALVWYIKSLTLKEQMKDQSGIATVCINMGTTYMEKKQYKEALTSFERGLKIEEGIDEKAGVSLILGNLGGAYRYIGDEQMTLQPDSAQAAYDLALEMSKRAEEIAVSIGGDVELKLAYVNLYRLYAKRNDLEMAFHYLNALTHRRDVNLKQNFFVLSEREKEIYYNTMSSDYELLYDFALFHQDSFPNAVDTALNYVLKNKAITLKSSTAMRQTILSSGDSVLIEAYQNWLELKKEIAQKQLDYKDVKSREEEARNLEVSLIKNSKEFRDYEALQKMNWKSVQEKLGTKEAAIEFIHFNTDIDTSKDVIYAALIITPTSEHPLFIRLCKETQLGAFFKNAAGSNLQKVQTLYGTKEALKTDLYQLIWEPMTDALKGVESVYISPSGLLHKVSFNALAKDKTTYLCQNVRIHQMGSTGQLQHPQSGKTNFSNTTYLIGGVEYNTDTTKNQVWSYLENTLTETNQIYNHLKLKKIRAERLEGKEASEAALKKICSQAGILHISTHGFFFPDPEEVRAEIKKNEHFQQDIQFRGIDDRALLGTSFGVYARWSFVENADPLMRSGVVLAGANDVWQRSALSDGEDGVLTAAEVATLDMRSTDLVVLSACETGLGDIKGSEGVYGLQRAFKMSGVKYLITSLWQVPDKETATFMSIFYEQLMKKGDIKASFEKTQEIMRKKYDPYFWAAFVLME